MSRRSSLSRRKRSLSHISRRTDTYCYNELLLREYAASQPEWIHELNRPSITSFRPIEHYPESSNESQGTPLSSRSRRNSDRIDLITDQDKKSDEICIIACHYALEKKNQQFVDIINKYGRHITWGKFEFKGEKNNLLMHLVSDVGANNLTCARYLLEKEWLTMQDHGLEIQDALEEAISRQNSNAIKVLWYAKSLNEQAKMVNKYAITQMKQESKCHQLLRYLSMTTSPSEFTMTMNSLFKVVVAMINDGKIISSDLFNMCWLQNKEQLWSAIFKKCKALFHADTLHQDALAWKWLEEHLINNRELLVWLDEIEPDQKENRVGPCNSSKKPEVEKKANENLDIEEKEEREKESPEPKSMEENKKENRSENNKNNNNVNIRWNLIENLCMQEVVLKQLKELDKKMKQDFNRYKKEYEELMSWKWDARNSMEPSGTKKQPASCRQDDDPKGVKCTLTLQQLLDIQMESDDVMFYPKHFYDFEVYLSELFTRAHKMNRAFQTEIKSIFEDCEGCQLEEGPIKSLKRSKLKAQVEYKNSPFPKSAQIVDIVRCQVTFDTIKHFLKGLKRFNVTITSPRYQNTLKVVRIKNEFAECLPSRSEQKMDKLDFSQNFKDIKMNILFTKNNESIVTEIQFSLKVIADLKKREHLFYEIVRQKSFLYDTAKVMHCSQFDVQLQVASFHPREMVNLMLFFPNHFEHSPLVHYKRDTNGSNFISQMANNSQVVHSYASLLLQGKRFLSQTTVESQLFQPNENSSYPLMFALWKQTSIETIKLFIPQDLLNARIVWNIINDMGMSCIEFGVRNTSVPFSKMLELLHQNVRDEDRWQSLLKRAEDDAGCTPLMTAVIFQAYLTLEDVKQLIPKKNTTEFWEKKCNQLVHSKTLLHLLFFRSLPNVKNRVAIFKKLVPKQSWENLVVTADDFNQTPLMEALARSPELDEDIISWLLPSKIDNSFWKQTISISRVPTELDEMNILHLTVQNSKIFVLKNLKYLQKRIPRGVWNDLLKMKDSSGDTPLDIAMCLNQPNEVRVELESK